MKKILLPLFLILITNITPSFAAKESISTKNAPKPIGVYSPAIKIGSTIYISGQIPIDPTTGDIVKGDFKNQAKQAFANVKTLTMAAGGNVNDIVKLTIYLTDLNNFAYVNEVMLELFEKPYPARAVIGIKALPKNAAIEIEAIMQKS